MTLDEARRAFANLSYVWAGFWCATAGFAAVTHSTKLFVTSGAIGLANLAFAQWIAPGTKGP